MSDTPLDDTNVITSPDVAAQATPEQDATPAPVSDDAAESANDSQVETPEADQESEQREPTRAEKRIQQTIRDKKFAMDFGNFQKDRADTLQRQLDDKPTTEAAPETIKRPKLEDFDFDQDAYDASMQDWNTHQITTQVKAGIAEAMQTQTQQTAQATLDAGWHANVAEFAKEHADFGEVAFATGDIYQAIKGLSDGPAIAYHLGQNPDVAQRIGTLPAAEMPFALGRLNLATKPSVPQKQATQAPDPMSPVGGSHPSTPLANETTSDYIHRVNAEEKARERRVH